MASLTISDLQSRTAKPMAKKKTWIKGAAKRPGALTAKAEKADDAASTAMKKRSPLHDHAKSPRD